MSERLLAAVKEGKLEAFYALVQTKSVDLNKESMLHWATLGRKLEMVDALLTAGADVNWPGLFDGQTPLYVAVSVASKELVDKLLKAGANPNLGKLSVVGSTAPDAPVEVLTSPLLKSIEWGGSDIAALLIAAGADVNQGDQDGYTPLTLATERANEAVVKLLLKSGASIEVCGPTGRSVYDMATTDSMRRILSTHRPGRVDGNNPSSSTSARKQRKKSGWGFFSLFRKSSTEAVVEEESVETAQVAGVKGPAVSTIANTHTPTSAVCEANKGNVGKVTAPAAVLTSPVGTVPPQSVEVNRKGGVATYAPPAVASALSNSNYDDSIHNTQRAPPVTAIGVVGEVLPRESAQVESLRQQLTAMERRVADLEEAARRDRALRLMFAEHARVIEQQGKDIAYLKGQLNQKPSV